jgi:hypothetical protein
MTELLALSIGHQAIPAQTRYESGQIHIRRYRSAEKHVHHAAGESATDSQHGFRRAYQDFVKPIGVHVTCAANSDPDLVMVHCTVDFEPEACGRRKGAHVDVGPRAPATVYDLNHPGADLAMGARCAGKTDEQVVDAVAVGITRAADRVPGEVRYPGTVDGEAHVAGAQLHICDGAPILAAQKHVDGASAACCVGGADDQIRITVTVDVTATRYGEPGLRLRLHPKQREADWTRLRGSKVDRIIRAVVVKVDHRSCARFVAVDKICLTAL